MRKTILIMPTHQCRQPFFYHTYYLSPTSTCFSELDGMEVQRRPDSAEYLSAQYRMGSRSGAGSALHSYGTDQSERSSQYSSEYYLSSIDKTNSPKYASEMILRHDRF